MADAPLVAPDRLDSWKAIAEYLGRDVATVRRWEKSQGLPVRRVGGGRGRSVFAYRSEIDKWLQEPHADTAPAEAPTRSRWRWILRAAAIGVVIAGVAWRLLAPSAEAGGLAVEVTAKGVVARGPDGVERWRHPFPADARVALPKERTSPTSVLTGRHGGVVVGTSHRLSLSDAAVTGGELLWLSPEGRLERTFSFDDRLSFGGASYAGPWVITDYRIDEGRRGRRFAVAAHHFQWWPSLVSVLDERWRRSGTFVNAGWVERAQWLSPDRLLIAGFSNARNGGMVALLDANALEGQSPPADVPGFLCTSCSGSATPVRYVVLPRSELNLVTASPFNRARVEFSGDGLVVQTVEVPDNEAQLAVVLYGFSRTLELKSASFGDSYWALHRSLEAAGKLQHPRERCPDRDGPRAIEVWERATGWAKRASPARP